MSKVSIIVPIYKVEPYVEKCIKSLMNQTFQEIEIWAISDGSPDKSIEIVKEFAKNDTRIKCIEKENGGYGSVLEYAIERIQTKYFLICDSDDWLEKDAIEKLYHCAEETEVDLVVGETYMAYSDGSRESVHAYSKVYPLKPNKVYDKLEAFGFISVTPHAKLYKTTLAKEIKFPHFVSYTDTVLYLIYLTNVKKAMYLDIPLSNYFFDRPGNTMSEIKTFSQRAFNAQMVVYKSVLEQLNEESNLYSLICYRLYALIFSGIKKMAQGRDKKQLQNNKKEIINFLAKLKSEKTNMKKYIKAENVFKTLAKKIMFDLIFCDATKKLVLNGMIALNK